MIVDRNHRRRPGVMRRASVQSPALVLIGLLVGGCAGLDQISEEGGLIRRILSRDTADSDAPPSPEARTAPASTQQASTPPSPTESFAEHARDHFFTLHWNAIRRGSDVEVGGLVENRNGPGLREVTLLISASGAQGEPLGMKRLVLWGPFEKKAVKPFTVAFPAARPPDRVRVTVESYEFPLLPGSAAGASGQR